VSIVAIDLDSLRPTQLPQVADAYSVHNDGDGDVIFMCVQDAQHCSDDKQPLNDESSIVVLASNLSCPSQC
jgi:hypothetical protein